MSYPFDASKTLDELDPPPWEEPAYDSHLVTTCHRLRKKPISELSAEHLRILIGQEIGLPWLMPLALDILECDPLIGGDFYPGDLLGRVLSIDGSWWSQEPRWRDRVHRIVAQLREIPNELHEDVATFRKNTV